MPQSDLNGINLANLATNLAQLGMMQRQLQNDMEMHERYYSTIVSLLVEIRDELREMDLFDNAKACYNGVDRR